MAGRPTQELRAPSPAQTDSVQFSGPRIALWLADPKTKVTLIGKSMIEDTKVIAIQPNSPSGDKFYFDTSSGLLVRRKSARWETTYQDYEKVGGMPIAKQITKKLDGKVWMTTKVLEFKVVDKHDPGLFRKP